jgi:hypothetical protein
MVKIVVSQDEVERDVNRLLHFMKELPQARRFGNIASNKDGIWLTIMNRRKKGSSLVRPQKVQMDIRCPNYSHRVHTLAKSRGIRSMVYPPKKGITENVQ